VSPCACFALLVVHIVVEVILGFETDLLVFSVSTTSSCRSVFYHPAGS
jgi:hypothetical protein